MFNLNNNFYFQKEVLFLKNNQCHEIIALKKVSYLINNLFLYHQITLNISRRNTEKRDYVNFVKVITTTKILLKKVSTKIKLKIY